MAEEQRPLDRALERQAKVEAARAEQLQEDKAIYLAFSSPNGKKALQIMEERYYKRPSYDPNLPQPYHTFFREGQRQVVGFIHECIERIRKEEK